MSLVIPVDAALSLRFVQPSHAEEIMAVVTPNRQYLTQWLPWAVEGYDVARCRDWIESMIKAFGERTDLALSIICDGRLVGGIGWNNWQTIDNRAWSLTAATADIGYWLAADAQGRGIATRSTRALADYGFNEVGLHRICIRAEPENKRSWAIPQRLGFQYEGTHRHVYRWNGRWVDHRVYAMLAKDWPGPA